LKANRFVKMKGVVLKLYLIFILVLSLSCVVQAQDLRFVYMQTENQKPFYIKRNEQRIASSASGYIIIPRLAEGIYKIVIGFPQSTLPEFSVTVNVEETDAGYLIKNDADQGSYVVDLKTMEPVALERLPVAVKNGSTIRTNDGFARISAEVVNDSSIAEITVFVKPALTTVKAAVMKAQHILPVQQSDSAIINKSASKSKNKTPVSKLAQKNTGEGMMITYLDNEDTVSVFLPVARTDIQAATQEKIDASVVAKKEIDSVKNIRFIEMELQNPNQQQDTGALKKDDFVIKEKKNKAAANAGIIQPDSVGINSEQADTTCKKTATESDFLQLRKVMAAEKSAADMLKLAVTDFRNTCYNTEQIKNLGLLFITEEERYEFYVAAFPYVLDAGNFGKLESQLADSYYITRFKAMLNH